MDGITEIVIPSGSKPVHMGFGWTWDLTDNNTQLHKLGKDRPVLIAIFILKQKNENGAELLQNESI